MTPPVGLTCGDPAGIGPELALAAWPVLRDMGCSYFYHYDHRFLDRFGNNARIVRIDEVSQASSAMPDGLPILHHAFRTRPVVGIPDPVNGASILHSVRRMVEQARSGAVLAVCTAPLSKKVIRDGTDPDFVGHTELLSTISGDTRRTVMMLHGPDLRVVPLTGHIPLHQVPDSIQTVKLRQTVEVVASSLARDFGIVAPRIAVAGLNPHAGEGGMLGQEERDILIPVLDSLRREGFALSGPLPADTMFHEEGRVSYDVALCMYHDQALIPLKTLNFHQGVNTTLGLSIVRTSPVHGTAFDIAGKNRALPGSLIAAVLSARDTALRRRRSDSRCP